MNRVILVITLIMTSLTACSWLGGRASDKTLANLEPASIPANKRQLAPPPRPQVIASYQALLDVVDDVELKAIVLHRIADLTMLNSEESQLDAKDAEQQTQRFYTIAIEAYQTLLQEHPNHVGKDAILYQLAKAYELSGQLERVMPVLDELIALKPQSRYYSEAQFRRGEYLFSQHRYRDAEIAYQASTQADPQSAYWINAVYMTGWSQYKQNLDTETLTTFIQVLDHYLKNGTHPESLARADRELLDDTLRVMSLQFADADQGQSIAQLFDKVGRRPYETLVYLHLGNTLLSKQRYKDAADVYLGFLNRYPKHEESPTFHEKIIQVYVDGKFPSLVIPEKEKYVAAYGVHSDYWKGQSPETRQRYLPTLTRYLTELAQYHHGMAQQSKKSGDYARAANWYQQLQDTVPTAATAFLIGETLYDAQQYKAAAQAYEKSAYQFPKHAQSNEAGYAALQAWEQARKQNTSAKDDVTLLQLQSAAQFGKHFSDDPRTPDITLHAAQTWMQLKKYPEVLATADSVLQSKHASADTRRTAHALKAQAAYEQGDYLQAESAYQSAISPGNKQDEASQALRESLAASIYKQGEQLQASGDKAGAVAQFLRIGAVAPGTSIQASAEYDAAALLLELKDWTQATRVLENFQKKYPKHPLNKDIPAKLAYAYQNAGQVSQAAGALEQLAQTESDSKTRRASLWQAATMYEQANDTRAAIRAYENYVRSYPTPFSEAMEARHKLTKLYERSGDNAKVLQWQQDIVKQEANGGGSRNARTKTIAAEAALALAALPREQFARIRLTLPLDKSFKAKKTALELALKAYTNVTSYGVQEYANAAAYQIGEIYAQLSRDLMASQRPGNLNELELEQYNVLLEEQAFPFEEKAIEIHVANTRKTQQGVYDAWVQKSFDALAKIMPGRYAKTEKRPEVSHAIH